MERIPITAAGAEKLKAELEYLVKVERHETVVAIEEARSKGDLSETAEYDAAREKQAFVEGRIAELEAKIPSLQIIDPKTLAAGGRIVFGATVELMNLDTEEVVRYQIVGIDEADVEHHKISVSSPFARAMIGKSEGDEVVVHAPKGDVSFEVLSVQYI